MKGILRMSRGRITTAIILIIIGTAYLFSNMGMLHIGEVIHLYWPCIFIFIGVINLVSSGGQRNSTAYIFILIGVILQANKFGWFTWEWHLYWPLIIILIGLWILFKPRSQKWWPGNKIGSDNFGITAVFGGAHRVIESTNFRGGEITAIFGGAEVDLRSAKTSEQDITINVTTIFGGVEIRVPSSWRVDMQVTPILGGSDDKRRSVVTDPSGGNPVLHIRGSVIFGGLEVKE